MSAATGWIEACDAGDIVEEDVIRFDHGSRTFAIYRLEDGYYATTGCAPMSRCISPTAS